jgi:hypothetical protein
MRKYTIPQSMSVEHLLTDHLGSTSLTTDSSGARISELRYTPFGEIRYSWTANLSTTPPYTPTRYTFTSQYSYLAQVYRLERQLQWWFHCARQKRRFLCIGGHLGRQRHHPRDAAP